MSDDEKANDNWRYYNYCRTNGHDQYIDRCELALDFYAGKQWTDAEISEMRGTNRPALTINQMYRTIDSLVGEMIYSTGDVRYTASDAAATDDVADAMDKIYLHTEQQNKLMYFDPQVVMMGLLTGRGFWDVRMSFDDQMQGNIVVNPRRPQNVILDPEIDSINTKRWPQVYTTRYASLDDIAYTFGVEMAKELENTPQSSWLSPYDMHGERSLSQRMTGQAYAPQQGDPRLVKARRLIERQYRTLKYKNFFVDVETGDMSEVPENWDRNRIANVVNQTGVQVIKRKTETIRWTVSCDRFLLHDEDSPYSDFTIVPFFPYFVDGYPMGLGENLIDLQKMFNKLMSQQLHILNSAANSGWKVKKGSLKNMTENELEERGAQTGLTMILDDVNDAERIEAASIPNGHDHLAGSLRNLFQDISGYNTTMQGNDRADASGKAIDSKIARGAVNLATAYNALYYAKTEIADRILSLAQTYYTETRLIKITGGIGQPSQGVTINQPTPEGEILNDITRGKYQVTVIPAPKRETVEQTVFQQLVEMRGELGVMIPDDVMIQYSSIPQKGKVLEAIKNAGGDPQQQAAEAQLEQQLKQAQLAESQAAAENSASQAELARARANKANADAVRDPQGDRIKLDAARMGYEAQRNAEKDQQEARNNAMDNAIKITDMQNTHDRETKKIDVQARQKAQQAKKTPASKPKQPRKRK